MRRKQQGVSVVIHCQWVGAKAPHSRGVTLQRCHTAEASCSRRRSSGGCNCPWALTKGTRTGVKASKHPSSTGGRYEGGSDDVGQDLSYIKALLSWLWLVLSSITQTRSLVHTFACCTPLPTIPFTPAQHLCLSLPVHHPSALPLFPHTNHSHPHRAHPRPSVTLMVGKPLTPF